MIPTELKQTEQWIAWKEEQRGDDLTKVPHAPWKHGGRVAANDPDNWTDYETAAEWVEKVPGLGIGFVFKEDGPFVGIDLDDCIKWDGGDLQILPSAATIVRNAGSFTEISPSGTGLHIYVKGELDHALKNDDEHVEMYDRDRFFTVTGHVFDEWGDDSPPREITPAPETLDWVMEEYMTEVGDEPPEEDPYESGETPDHTGDGEPHPISDLDVEEVYRSLPKGKNVEHPIHDSSTGSNFKIHSDGENAVCWRGRHQYGQGDGCLLSAWHLLAMEYHGIKNCREMRQRYPQDDELAFGAWVEAYRQNLVSGENPPWRAVRYIVNKHGLSNIDEGGTPAWAAYRSACRIIRAEYDVPVEIEDDEDDDDGAAGGVLA